MLKHTSWTQEGFIKAVDVWYESSNFIVSARKSINRFFKTWSPFKAIDDAFNAPQDSNLNRSFLYSPCSSTNVYTTN